MTDLHLWLRHEVRSTERRTPVVPDDARRLVRGGVRLTVEESPQRIFPAAEYEAVGARIVPAGSWQSAPRDTVVLGLKELPDEPGELTHRHIFFGHAYKGQPGAVDLLRRFAAGGGALLDLEYLVDDRGRRLAAFGFWAGYLGAALAVLRHRDRRALLDHDVLVNCVLATTPVPPFVREEDLDDPARRLRTLSDVTCDVGSPLNVLPVYDRTTERTDPVRRLAKEPPLDLIAIDNLPSLLPEESSVGFSGSLLPLLLEFGVGGPWGRCLDRFHQACRELGIDEGEFRRV